MMDGFSLTDVKGSRKSERERKKKRSFSPAPDANGSKLTAGQAVKKKKKSTTGSAFAPDRPYDRLPNGMPFRCDLCKSSYVCNPLMSKRASRVKRSKHMPSPRFKTDHSTGKTLMLCNACGIALDRPKKPKKEKPMPTQEEKDKYLLESKLFASNLAVEIQIPEAQVLFCPTFKMAPCRCLQNYIMSDGKEMMKKKAEGLCFYHKEAGRLSALKFYDVDKVVEPGRKGKRARNIGLGNGQKKSEAYESFVLKVREILRNKMSLCERATQKILRYSNNFLHKKLKTEERGCRAQRVKGKAALGLLPCLDQLHKEKCCIDNCVRMALTHCRLLEQWRSRATSGQQEARRVLAEMLTPSGGVRSNCYKFITWVTGCSASTIGKVNDQMKQTGGEREPPQHGLRKYWMNNPRRGAASDTLSQIQSDNANPPSPVISPSTTPESRPVSLSSTSIQPTQIPSTQGSQGEGQQQTVQHQTQLLKVLEQKLMQTKRMQQTLMHPVARPDVAQNLASVQGMLNQLSKMQAAATVQTASVQPGSSQVTVNHPVVSLQNSPPQLSSASTGQSVPNQSKSAQSGQPIHQVNVRNHQQMGSVVGQPQFAAVPIPILNNSQPNVLHLQAPNIQIKVAQPQYIIQTSPGKQGPGQTAVQTDHQYVAPAGSSVTPSSNVQPSKGDVSSLQVTSSGVTQSAQKEKGIQHPSTRSEPVNFVKIGNQVHHIVNLCPQSSPQMVMQPLHLQNVRPNVGLRVPVIHQNQIPQPQGVHQEQFFTPDVNRHQMPQFVTLAQINADQLLQPKGVQNICVPARLPVGSPISVQQLQQMVLQSSRFQQEVPLQQQRAAHLTKLNKQSGSTQPVSTSVKETTVGTSAISETQSEQSGASNVSCSLSGREQKASGSTQMNESVPSAEILASKSIHPPARECPDFQSTQTNQTCLNNSSRSDQIESEIKVPSFLNEQGSVESTKLNLNDLENHALGELGHLQNVSDSSGHVQGHTGQGQQQGMNCALLVHPLQTSSSDSVISSGHQTPSCEVDEMLRSIYFNRHGDLDLISPLTLPDNLTRSRNNSGESTIEPTVSVDMTSIPRELLSLFTQQGVTITISNGQAPQNGQ